MSNYLPHKTHQPWTIAAAYLVGLPGAAMALRVWSAARVDDELVRLARRRSLRATIDGATLAREHLRVACAVAQRLPGRPTCLTRVTAVRYLLALHGIHSTWVFGHAFAGSANAQFHAWLRVAGEDIDSISPDSRVEFLVVSDSAPRVRAVQGVSNHD